MRLVELNQASILATATLRSIIKEERQLVTLNQASMLATATLALGYY